MELEKRCFYDCSISEKLLYTAFLLLMGVGYLMALVYLYTGHEGHDSRPGLSVEDIVYNYYGNRSGTKIEAAIRGPMAPYITLEERHHVVQWLKSGAAEKDYELKVRPILAKNCVNCHNPDSGQKIPDLSSFSSLGEVAKVDTGVDLHSLMKLSHIHMFGIGMLLLGVGLIFRFAVLRPLLKYSLVLIPFAAVFADITAWFLTKWDPFYAYTIIIAGALLGLAFAAQILTSLYQIWFLKPGVSG